MISQETIAAVRERTDIVALIGENVRLTKKGRSFLGLCPFHKEKTPSFSVNQERGFFHCFGCKESGSAIDYLMKLEGLSFPEAVRALAERVGIVIEETGSREERDRDDRRRRDREDLFRVSELAASFFEAQLGEGGHPLRAMALAELSRRGLSFDDAAAAEAMRAFRVGYAPHGWDGLVTWLRKQGLSPALAERVGVVAARRSGDGFYDAFRHRLMFGVVDKSGRVVAFSGRALPAPSEADLSRHGLAPLYRDGAEREPPKYINSPESPIYVKGDTVFGLYQGRLAIREAEKAVLVEGNFDVLSLHARGFPLAVAPLGTAFTEAQARLVKRYAPEVVVMFDGDRAGKKAAAQARGPARAAGLSIKVASLPDGVDPDDHARSRGVASVRAIVDNAKGMLEWLIDEMLGKMSGSTLREKHARIRKVTELLAEEQDPSLRAMAKAYADRLSSELVVDGESPADIRALERMIGQALHGAAAGPAPRETSSAPVDESTVEGGAIALAALGAILDFPELLDDPEMEEPLTQLSGDTALAVAAVRQVWDIKKSLDGPEILDLLPRAIHSFAVGRLASPRFGKVADAQTELLENAEKLRQRSLTGDKAVKVRELVRAQELGDVDAQDELLREISRMAKQRRRLS